MRNKATKLIVNREREHLIKHSRDDFNFTLVDKGD